MAKKQEPNGAFQALKKSLREKKTQRLYVFHGEERFLLHHYLGQLKKLLIDPLTEAFNYHELKAETFQTQSLIEAVENLPMMAQSSMVWVDEVDLFKLPEAERERLAALFSDMPDYCTLVFTYETTPWKPDKRQKKLWEALDKNGTVVEFAKQSRQDLTAWIVRHFAARQKRISTQLCAYLIEITGGTMTALSGEISKIAAYSGADEIQKSDIDAVTEPVLDAVVFRMTECLSSRNYASALEQLQQLLKMQQEPLAILGAIGAHFRRLGAAKTLLENKRGVFDLMQLCSMSDYAAQKTFSAASRLSSTFCASANRLIVETDYAIKTSYDEPERLLETLIVQLAQEARRG